MLSPRLATSVIVGPPGHGAVRHAETIAAITCSSMLRMADGLSATSAVGTPVAHVHYTDRLFGSTTESAVAAFARLVAALRARLVVTLHDVPAVDGSGVAIRRVRTYRRVSELADALVVSSAHEHRRLRACGVDAAVTVIPLPIEPSSSPTPAAGFTATGPAVGVLGFVYPGKGHDDVLRAAARLPADVGVWALGAVSPGHEALVAELHRQAAGVGRHLNVTGHLDDQTLAGALRSVDVPVVPAVAPAASASLATWIAAGRRPVTAASEYACELTESAPDLLTVYPPGDDAALAEAINRALADRTTTERTVAIPESFRERAVAERHVDLYRTLAGADG